MTPKLKTFCERLFSTVVLLGALGATLWWGEPIGYALLLCLLCNLTSVEWYRMLRDKKDEVCRPAVLAFSLVYPWLQLGMLPQMPIDMGLGDFSLAYLILYTLVLFICGLFRMDYRSKSGAQMLSGMGLGLLAFVYPVWLFGFSFRFLVDPQSISLLLLLILATKMSDIWAYVCGVLLGGRFIARRFSPAISPKKTWEGIIGSCIITAVATYALLQYVPYWEELRELITPTVFCVTLPIVFILSVAGDLAGSLIKRGIGVKDSGSLLPGIGGIFDLIDSPAFTVSALIAFLSLAA